jgi:hypothetical protein
MSRTEPELNPENPQKKGNDAMNSTSMTTTNEINGGLNIDKLYPEIKDKKIVPYENPYTIQGGGKKNEYRFISKPGDFFIPGRNPMDALRNGLEKLENQNKNIYNQSKKITINLQKNSKRANKIHKFMVKIFRIEHPIYKYKIEIWKL